MIPQEIIDQILDRLDIVEVISEYIPLKKSGRNFKACCPFHNEKTPSFVVSPDKQIFHCFGGCAIGGNLIKFIMKHENLTFPEAVRIAAAKAGIALPKYERPDGESNSLASRLYEINNTATAFYQNFLRSPKGKGALEYLKKRGFSSDIISEFRIGCAPDSWESFRKYCESKKISAELARKAGLTIPSEKGKGDYDRFRKRITFPIFNERGNISGLGARVMDNSLPKYINSPETVIYSKSNVLYGLNFSKKSIRAEGYAILVEGYMDVIIPYQYGVTNVVATSGTALTSRQVDLLKKHANTAVMVFDADSAGVAASLRGLDILIENGLNVRIATLPEGEDPDSFVREHGKEGFMKEINAAKDLFDYKLDLLLEKKGKSDIGGVADDMLPTIAKVQNAVVQSDYLKKLAERLGVHEASMRYEMGKVKPDYSYHYASEAKVDVEVTNYRSSELHLLGLALSAKRVFTLIQRELGLHMFRDINVKKVMDMLERFYDENDENINVGKLMSRMENDADAGSAVVQAIAKAEITQDIDKAVQDCMICVKKENREEKLKDLTSQLKKAQASHDDTGVIDILGKINKIHKEKVA